MKLDLGSFSFGSTLISGSGTPSWGTSFGQSKPELKFKRSGYENIIVGMLYKSIPIDKVYITLGKEKRKCKGIEDEGIQLAACFNKVYINKIEIGAPFVMLVYKESSKSWNGRRTLKYNENIEYHESNESIIYNTKFITSARKVLQLEDNACWFVYNFEIHNQDELHMSAVIVDSEKNIEYADSDERSQKWSELIPEDFVTRDINELIKAPQILYGPPGTGKTFKMQKDYISNFDNNDKYITTFHQSFSYEEFVEGLKPVMNSENESGEIKYTIETGIFKKACEQAAKLAGFENLKECINASFEERNQAFEDAMNNGQNVLLCIDEINRGNVASIFGDLISLIETNKRLGAENEMKVILPYSKEEFGVPANLLIVGTMNTADRSIQLLDTALRRRFKFKELLPEYKVINNEQAKTILANINARIRCLLNKDYQIGHAYFIHANSMKDILSAMLNKVIPLLEEYFYNDTEKIRFVLNEDGKTDYTFYVMDEDAKKVYDLYNKEGIDDDKNFYRLNDKLNEELNEEECSKFLNNLLAK